LAQICGLDVSAVVDVSMVAKAATASLAPVPEPVLEEPSSGTKIVQAPPGTEGSPKLAAPKDGHAAAPHERAISVVDESKHTTGSPIPRTARGIKALYVYSPTSFMADTKIEPMTGAPIPPGVVKLSPGIYRLPGNANIVAVKDASTSSYSIASFDTKGGSPDPPLQALQNSTADEIMAFLSGAGEEDEI